jgi:hypothetical protein
MPKIKILTGLFLVFVGFVFGFGIGNYLVSKPVPSPTKKEKFVQNAVYTLGGTFDQIEGKDLVLTAGQEKLKVGYNLETRVTLMSRVSLPTPGSSTASAQVEVNPEITREASPSVLEKGDRLTIKAELVQDKFVLLSSLVLTFPKTND